MKHILVLLVAASFVACPKKPTEEAKPAVPAQVNVVPPVASPVTPTPAPTGAGTTTVSGAIATAIPKTAVKGQQMGSGEQALSSLKLTFNEPMGDVPVNFVSNVMLAGELKATTYTATNTKMNSSTLQHGSDNWAQTWTGNDAQTKGTLTITITSLGTPENMGATVDFTSMKGTFTAVMKSEAADGKDVTVTGTF